MLQVKLVAEHDSNNQQRRYASGVIAVSTVAEKRSQLNSLVGQFY
jgi:hypothetical protein